MAISLVYAPRGLRRFDGLDVFLVSTTTDTDDAAQIKAEKLAGVYDGSGSPSKFKDFLVTRIRPDSIWAYDGTGWVPDVCFQGARLIGPRSIHPGAVSATSDIWPRPRLGRGGRFLRGAPWLFGD